MKLKTSIFTLYLFFIISLFFIFSNSINMRKNQKHQKVLHHAAYKHHVPPQIGLFKAANSLKVHKQDTNSNATNSTDSTNSTPPVDNSMPVNGSVNSSADIASVIAEILVIPINNTNVDNGTNLTLPLSFPVDNSNNIIVTVNPNDNSTIVAITPADNSSNVTLTSVAPSDNGAPILGPISDNNTNNLNLSNISLPTSLDNSTVIIANLSRRFRQDPSVSSSSPPPTTTDNSTSTGTSTVPDNSTVNVTISISAPVSNSDAGNGNSNNTAVVNVNGGDNSGGGVYADNSSNWTAFFNSTENQTANKSFDNITGPNGEKLERVEFVQKLSPFAQVDYKEREKPEFKNHFMVGRPVYVENNITYDETPNIFDKVVTESLTGVVTPVIPEARLWKNFNNKFYRSVPYNEKGEVALDLSDSPVIQSRPVKIEMRKIIGATTKTEKSVDSNILNVPNPLKHQVYANSYDTVTNLDELPAGEETHQQIYSHTIVKKNKEIVA